ncbi:MAG: hypothetical protein L0Y56_09485 [Nitrospira sp.]|nr:hypothetical protein [Nitrospira sp.]
MRLRILYTVCVLCGYLKFFRASFNASIPFADVEGISQLIISDKIRADVVEELEKSKRNLPDTCSALASLKFDKVQIRIDDQAFLAHRSDGSTVGIVN